MTTDTYANRGGVDSPAEQFVAITPSNSVDLTYLTRALYVGTGGDVAVVGMNDAVVTFKNVPTGATLAVRAKRINVTNTTASNIVGLW